MHLLRLIKSIFMRGPIITLLIYLSIKEYIMSCSNQCCDIEDIADNLFEFEDGIR
jgi:hypothetical protein